MPSFVVGPITVVARNRNKAIRKALRCQGTAFLRPVHPGLGGGRNPVCQVNRYVARLVRAHLAGELRWRRHNCFEYRRGEVSIWDGWHILGGQGFFIACRGAVMCIGRSWPEAQRRIHGLWGIRIEAPKGLGGKWA